MLPILTNLIIAFLLFSHSLNISPSYNQQFSYSMQSSRQRVLSPEGQIIASVIYKKDSYLKIFKKNTNESYSLISELNLSGQNEFTAISLSEMGNKLAIADYNQKRVTIHNKNSNMGYDNVENQQISYPNLIFHTELSEDGNLLCVVGAANSVYIYSYISIQFQLLQQLNINSDSNNTITSSNITACTFSNDKKSFVIAIQKKYLLVYKHDTTLNKFLFSHILDLNNTQQAIYDVAISQNGLVLSIATSSQLIIYKRINNTSIFTIHQNILNCSLSKGVYTLDMTADGKFIYASCFYPSPTFIYANNSNYYEQIQKINGGDVYEVSCTNDGKYLTIGDYQSSFMIVYKYKCSDAQFQSGSQCQSCHASCKTCNGSTSNNCLSCGTFSYLITNWCLICHSNEYKTQTNNCATCHPLCLTCFQATQDSCNSCVANYQIVNFKCVFKANSVSSKNEIALIIILAICIPVGIVLFVALFFLIRFCFCKHSAPIREIRQSEQISQIEFYQGNEIHYKNQTCSICLFNAVTILTPCKHFFHEVCIKTWIKKNKRCPLCRNTLRIQDLRGLK